MAKKAEGKETNQTVQQAEADRRLFAQSLKEQDVVPVTISPLYKPYFGKVMTVTINGVSVTVPVDGKTYDIPVTFASEVNRRKFRQDRMFEKKRGMSNISNNFETTPGELTLF